MNEMQYFDEQDDRRRRMWWSIAGVVLYAVVCVGVMFITYRISLPEPEMGILVDFGVGETGGGEDDTALSEQEASPVAPEPVPPTEREPVLTAEEPDAPDVAAEPEPEPVVPQVAAPEPAPEPPVREVNRQALFPGRTEGSTSASQGASEGAGNQGVRDGVPEGSDSEGGGGSSGFSLSGRYLVGNLPRPAYDVDEGGRVVIRITVNAEGVVTNAVYEQAGSTTNHGELVGAARTAARKARFTPSENQIQTGTITYIFRLN